MRHSTSRKHGDCRFVVAPDDAGWIVVRVIGVVDVWSVATLITIIEQNGLESIRLDLEAVASADAVGCDAIVSLLARRDVEIGVLSSDQLDRLVELRGDGATAPGLHAVA